MEYLGITPNEAILHQGGFHYTVKWHLLGTWQGVGSSDTQEMKYRSLLNLHIFTYLELCTLLL